MLHHRLDYANRFLSQRHLETIRWRAVALDAGLLALFLLTSSWLSR